MDNEIKVFEKTDKSSLTTEDGPEKKNNILVSIYAIKPILYLENIFGITRFCITDDTLEPTDVKRKIFGVFVSSLYVASLTVLSIFDDANKGSTGINYDASYTIPTVIYTFEFVVFLNVTSFFYSEINISIFTAMNRIDNVLQINMRTEMYSKQRRRYVKLLIALFMYHVASDTSEFFSDPANMSYYRMLLWPLYFFQDMEVINFCNMVLMQKHRLHIINNFLTKMTSEKNGNENVFAITAEKKDKKFNQPYKKVGVRELASMYDIIGETCFNINTVFNFHLLMTLVTTFMYVVISIWTSLYAYRTGNDISGSLKVLLTSGVGGICGIVALSLSCQSLLTARNETKVLINELIMNYDLPRITRNTAKSFMELVEAWPLQFTVYDMFWVDITLILKFVSVSTTYLIVIIQISHFV